MPNVISRHISDSSRRDENHILLTLHPGESGRIAHIDAPELEIALLKMGVTVGDEVSFAGAAPLNDPVSIRVHRTKLLLRREDASHIWINRK